MRQGRRRFLKSLGVLSAAGRIPATLAEEPAPRTARASVAPAPETPTLSYLTPREAEFVDAALARLIPADELGPGAKEAGVCAFIDRQLAGDFGTMARSYRGGP
jgi:gluconate 2-dehydrogenase gamma chain